MSFAMVVVQDDFIITTSDLATTYFPKDEEVYKETGELVQSGEMIKTDITSKKTHKLSDKVVLIITGLSVITETLLVELSERVKEDTDLHEMNKLAQEVMSDLRDGKVNHLDKILDNLKEKMPTITEGQDLETGYGEMVALLINEARGLSAYLTGYSDDGTSGLVDIKANEIMTAPKDKTKGYPVALVGDTISEELHSMYLQVLNLPSEDRTLNLFMEAMIRVHAHVSFMIDGVNVSPECHFKIFTRDGEQINYSILDFDTSTAYKELGFIKE